MRVTRIKWVEMLCLLSWLALANFSETFVMIFCAISKINCWANEMSFNVIEMAKVCLTTKFFLWWNSARLDTAVSNRQWQTGWQHRQQLMSVTLIETVKNQTFFISDSVTDNSNPCLSILSKLWSIHQEHMRQEKSLFYSVYQL